MVSHEISHCKHFCESLRWYNPLFLHPRLRLFPPQPVKRFRSPEHHAAAAAAAAEEIPAPLVPARGHTSMFFPLSLIIFFYFVWNRKCERASGPWSGCIFDPAEEERGQRPSWFSTVSRARWRLIQSRSPRPPEPCSRTEVRPEPIT